MEMLRRLCFRISLLGAVHLFFACSPGTDAKVDVKADGCADGDPACSVSATAQTKSDGKPKQNDGEEEEDPYGDNDKPEIPTYDNADAKIGATFNQDHAKDITNLSGFASNEEIDEIDLTQIEMKYLKDLPDFGGDLQTSLKAFGDANTELKASLEQSQSGIKPELLTADLKFKLASFSNPDEKAQFLLDQAKSSKDLIAADQQGKLKAALDKYAKSKSETFVPALVSKIKTDLKNVKLQRDAMRNEKAEPPLCGSVPQCRVLEEIVTRKVIIMREVKQYLAIWLDPRKEIWSGHNSRVAPVEGKIFVKAENPVVPGVSIQQPQSKFAQMSTAEQLLGVRYMLLGHIAWAIAGDSPNAKALEVSPKYATPVVALFKHGKVDKTAFAPPKEYKKVFKHISPGDAALFQRCIKMGEDMAKGTMHIPDMSDSAFCEVMQAGSDKKYSMEHVAQGGKGAYSLQDFNNKLSVVIWKPVPEKGYKCLGQLATNTEADPETVYDNLNAEGQKQAQQGAGGTALCQQNPQSSLCQGLVATTNDEYEERIANLAAMICVKDKYVEEGELAPSPTFKNDDVAFYTIVRKSGKTGVPAGMFWAIDLKDPSIDKNPKVYVLKKEFVKTFP